MPDGDTVLARCWSRVPLPLPLLLALGSGVPTCSVVGPRPRGIFKIREEGFGVHNRRCLRRGRALDRGRRRAKGYDALERSMTLDGGEDDDDAKPSTLRGF